MKWRRFPLLLAAAAWSSALQGADCPAGAARSADSIRLEVQRAIEALESLTPSHRAVARQALGRPSPAAGASPSSFVDAAIFGRLEREGVAPAPPSSDAEFLRRVTLDLTGRIPDLDVTVAFLVDPSPEKRARKVEELLASDAFVERWAFFLDELFRVTAYTSTSVLEAGGRDAWHRYFVGAIREGTPYDEIARTVLVAGGSTLENGPANFVARDLAFNGPAHDTWDNLAVTTGRALLGIDLSCVSCHDGAGRVDSLSLWLSTRTRRDFWGLAAFFANTWVDVRYLEEKGEFRFRVFEAPFLEYVLATDYGNKSPRARGADGLPWATPRFILTGERPGWLESRRESLARLVTSHRQFSRAAVNRVFGELFGMGLVEPRDGFDLARLDPGNPPPEPWTIQPTHPELLEELSARFESGGYDLRALVRTLVSSRAYQLSSAYEGEWKASHVPLFARRHPRRLRAEELHDALSQATFLPLPLHVTGWSEPVAWAGQLPDVLEPRGPDPGGVSYVVRDFLSTFGRGDRDLSPRSPEGSVLQAIQMLDSPLVTYRVKAALPGTLVSRLLAARLPVDQEVDVLFLATLGRFPSPGERDVARAILSRERHADALEDLHFALLNRLEFQFSS